MVKAGVIGISVVVIVLAIIIGIFVFSSSESQQGENSAFPAPGNLDVPEMIVSNGEESNEEGSEEIVEERPTEKFVEITSSGFSPKTLTINSGDKVTWINKGSTNSWPASSNHPTHTVYPGSSISKCSGSERGNIFDACSSLKTEGSYSFTFNEVGTWNYHDHLISSKQGTVIVN